MSCLSLLSYLLQILDHYYYIPIMVYQRVYHNIWLEDVPAQIMLNLLTPFLSVLALTLLRGWRIAVVVGVFHGTPIGGHDTELQRDGLQKLLYVFI